MKFTVEDFIRMVREAKANSTTVNGWYHNGGTVRGPFNRWLEVTAVAPQYKQHVAAMSEDAKYASVAMNMAPILCDEIEKLQLRIKELELDLQIDTMLRRDDVR